MTFLTQRDFTWDTSLGIIGSFKSITIRGCNLDIDMGVSEDLTSLGGDYVFPTVARVHDIVSSDGNDTSAGTGARTVSVKGLDTNKEEIEEIITLNGITNVPTVNSYLRINSLEVLTAGTSEANEGIVKATAQTDLTITRQIEINKSIDHYLIFSVPSNKTALIQSVGFSVNKKQSAKVDFTAITITPLGVRRVGTPTTLSTDGLTTIGQEFDTPIIAPSGLDLLIRVESDANNTMVSGTITLILVDNEQIPT